MGHIAILMKNLYTAFDLSCRSAFDETTATLPNPRTSVHNASSIPPSVILCQVTDYVEV